MITRVTVTMADADHRLNGRFIVEDDGSGMDFERVTGAWLGPGTDVRQRRREVDGYRTPLHGRLPLGEKGVGRVAVDKLGKHIPVLRIKRLGPEADVVTHVVVRPYRLKYKALLTEICQAHFEAAGTALSGPRFILFVRFTRFVVPNARGLADVVGRG